MQSSTSTRLSIALMLFMVATIVIMEASANPNPDPHDANVADAIRWLQDIENKHAQFARPRFGKRGNEYLNKEYTNNYLRFLLENPEYFQQLQQQQQES